MCLQLSRSSVRQQTRQGRNAQLRCSSEPTQGSLDCSRRQMHALTTASAALALLQHAPPSQALTLADVTPDVAPLVPLSAR